MVEWGVGGKGIGGYVGILKRRWFGILSFVMFR